MDGGTHQDVLETLATTVEQRLEDVGDDRKMFFDGLHMLQQGDVEEATRRFRRAVRQCDEPFAVMARMALGRCEVVRGHQGAALRVFRQVATSTEVDGLRRLAWMEVADLAEERGDRELLGQALGELAQGQVGAPR